VFCDYDFINIPQNIDFFMV